METEQAIQQEVLPRKRAWVSRWSGAFFVSAALVPLMLAFWTLGGLDAMGVAYALMKGETLFVDSFSKSFGIVQTGDPIAVSYRLTNRGDQSVRVVGCQAICTCIVPDDLPFTLHPKESRDLKISILNPKTEDKGPSQAINWGITLFTTNPAQIQVPLTVKGEIRARSNPSPFGS